MFSENASEKSFHHNCYIYLALSLYQLIDSIFRILESSFHEQCYMFLWTAFLCILFIENVTFLGIQMASFSYEHFQCVRCIVLDPKNDILFFSNVKSQSSQWKAFYFFFWLFSNPSFIFLSWNWFIFMISPNFWFEINPIILIINIVKSGPKTEEKLLSLVNNACLDGLSFTKNQIVTKIHQESSFVYIKFDIISCW